MFLRNGIVPKGFPITSRPNLMNAFVCSKDKENV